MCPAETPPGRLVEICHDPPSYDTLSHVSGLQLTATRASKVSRQFAPRRLLNKESRASWMLQIVKNPL